MPFVAFAVVGVVLFRRMRSGEMEMGPGRKKGASRERRKDKAKESKDRKSFRAGARAVSTHDEDEDDLEESHRQPSARASLREVHDDEDDDPFDVPHQMKERRERI